MYKNKPHKHITVRSYCVVTGVAFCIYLLGGCAKSHQRTNGDDEVDDDTAATEDSDTFVLDSNQEDVLDATDVRDRAVSLLDSGVVFQTIDADELDLPTGPLKPPEPRTEILEALETLEEPEFDQPLETLATEHCGYIFKAESTINWVSRYDKSFDEKKASAETRVFDKAGRLVAAEFELDTDYIPPALELIQNTRRLQIDYDQSARPIRVRIGPAFVNPNISPTG